MATTSDTLPRRLIPISVLRRDLPQLLSSIPLDPGTLQDNVTPGFEHSYVLDAMTRTDALRGATLCDYDGRVLALGILEDLPWDSEIYKLKMAKISWLLAAENDRASVELKRNLVAAILDGGAAEGYQHIMARIALCDRAAIHALETSGFRSMDVQVTLTFDPRFTAPKRSLPGDINIGSFRTEDLAALVEMSNDVFVESRLHVDQSLPKDRTSILHQRWVENDCTGRAAIVFVARIGDQPVGYTACLIHESKPELGLATVGDIDLVAVSERARGKGIAFALVQAAVAWLSERCDSIIVKTQGSNFPAIGLYQRCGFVLTRAFATLHWTSL